MHKTKKLDSS